MNLYKVHSLEAPCTRGRGGGGGGGWGGVVGVRVGGEGLGLM